MRRQPVVLKNKWNFKVYWAFFRYFKNINNFLLNVNLYDLFTTILMVLLNTPKITIDIKFPRNHCTRFVKFYLEILSDRPRWPLSENSLTEKRGKAGVVITCESRDLLPHVRGRKSDCRTFRKCSPSSQWRRLHRRAENRREEYS